MASSTYAGRPPDAGNVPVVESVPRAVLRDGETPGPALVGFACLLWAVGGHRAPLETTIHVHLFEAIGDESGTDPEQLAARERILENACFFMDCQK